MISKGFVYDTERDILALNADYIIGTIVASEVNSTKNAYIGSNLYMNANTFGQGIFLILGKQTSITVVDPNKGMLFTGGGTFEDGE